MKRKPLFVLFVAAIFAAAAWFIHVPDRVQADAVPEKYRDTVQKARAYLISKQHDDGHWEGDDGKHPVAMTGLVGLALSMEQDYASGGLIQPQSPPKDARVKKAVNWLMSKSRRDGLIHSGHASETSRYMEGHALAMIFLAAQREAGDTDLPPQLRDVLTRGVRFIVKSQSSRGGWHRTSRIEGHDFDENLATALQIQALQAAEYAGIPIRQDVLNDAQEYLATSLAKGDVADPNRRRDTAAALAVRIRPQQGRGTLDDTCKKWLQACEAELTVGKGIKFGREELAHFFFAQAVLLRDDAKNGYRTALCDHMQSTQGKDGSWPAAEGLGVGPVYTTALWCTVLQLDNRSHPSLRNRFENLTILKFEVPSDLRFASRFVGRTDFGSSGS